jgi:transcriptional regulator with PAS, ATPase and Fis domain
MVRERFEAAVCRVVGLRAVRLIVGQAARSPAGPSPVRDAAVLIVPVRPGQAVLQVTLDRARRLDGWEQQMLEGAAALATLILELERPFVRSHRHDHAATGDLLGSSRTMDALRERIDRVARTEAAVLIEGESGVGKELVAQQIHRASRRARGPFVAVNCAALVETLLETELFGIEDRTATGVRGRRGKFELADGGTLFLDEIGDLSLTAQAKLLRALQEMVVERVGGHVPLRVNARVIAATNRNLSGLVEEGRFRQDLFYRLNCVEIRVPPLRARRGDIRELVDVFVKRYAEGQPVSVGPEVLDVLVGYDWPGNVRELERVIQRAVALSESGRIGIEDLPRGLTTDFGEIFEPALAGRESMRAFASRYARLVLFRSDNNKREACRRLGISYHTLQAHLRVAARADAQAGPPATAPGGIGPAGGGGSATGLQAEAPGRFKAD